MKYSDLISGKHVVKIESGEYFLVTDINLMGYETHFCPKPSHLENFKHEYSNPELDIIEVFEITYGFTGQSLKDGGCLKSVYRVKHKTPEQTELEELEKQQREIADKMAKLREKMKP